MFKVNNKIKLIISAGLLLFSVITLATFSVAWFNSNRLASGSGNDISAKAPDISKIGVTIYRSDGYYGNFDSSGNFVTYDESGNDVSSSTTLSMFEYDRIITERNEVNNLIFKIDLSLTKTLATTNRINVLCSFTEGNETFGSHSDSDIYHLSDVINLGIIKGSLVTPSGSTSLAYYEAATAAFSSYTYSSFSSISNDVVTKTNDLSLNTDYLENTTAKSYSVYLNYAYNADLCDKLYTMQGGSIDSVTGTLINLKSDISNFFSII